MCLFLGLLLQRPKLHVGDRLVWQSSKLIFGPYLKDLAIKQQNASRSQAAMGSGFPRPREIAKHHGDPDFGQKASLREGGGCTF